MKKIFVMSASSDLGGIEKSLIEFLHFLSKEDTSIDLALWKSSGPLFAEIPKNINIIEGISPGTFSELKKYTGFDKIKKTIRYLSFRFLKFFACPWKSCHKLKENYDIAISFCQNSYVPYFVIDKVDAKCKYLFYHHGSYEKDNKSKLTDKKYYAKYNKIVTVSNANKEMLSLHFPELSDKIIVINNLLNEDNILQKSQEKIKAFNDFVGCKLCTVGRLAEEKGQLYALEVAKHLKEKDFNFKWVFVGDGPNKDQCERKINNYRLNNYCFLVGAKTNPYPYIYNSDLYVQTSFVEADPITIMEAIILNKVIIATEIPALKESLHNGNLGCLCEFDAQVIADKIIYYAEKTNQTKFLNNLSTTPSRNVSIKKKIKELLEL